MPSTDGSESLGRVAVEVRRPPEWQLPNSATLKAAVPLPTPLQTYGHIAVYPCDTQPSP